MITFTFSVKPSEANAGVIAYVAQLLAKLETQAPAMAQAKKSMAGKVARIQGTVHPAPKPAAKKPMPAKGRKVEPKPSAE